MKTLKFELEFEIPSTASESASAACVENTLRSYLPPYYKLVSHREVPATGQTTYKHTIWRKTDHSGSGMWAAVRTPGHRYPVEIEVPIDWGFCLDTGCECDNDCDCARNVSVYALKFFNDEDSRICSIEDLLACGVFPERTAPQEPTPKATQTSPTNQTTEKQATKATAASPCDTYVWTIWRSNAGTTADYSLFEDADFNTPVVVDVPRRWKPAPSGEWAELHNWEFIDDLGLRRSADDAATGNWEPGTTTIRVFAYHGISGQVYAQDTPREKAVAFDIKIPDSLVDAAPIQHLIYGLQTRQIKFPPLVPLPI